MSKKRWVSTKQCETNDCKRPVLARGMCGPHYAMWHRALLKYTITCLQCGKTLRVGRPRAKYCSRLCSSLAAQPKAHLARVNQQRAERANRNNHLLPVLYTGPPWKPTRQSPLVIKGRVGKYFSGSCRICSTWFISINIDVTCSPECHKQHSAIQRRLAKDRRRTRQRNAFVEDVVPKQVFERDGYRCHLCSKKTARTKAVPHPKAPTIDHVIPLSLGGTHEPLNCRTACFLCNSLKGARGGGEQLLLIA